MEPQDKKNEKPLSFEELADQKPDKAKNSKSPESASESASNAESAKKPEAPAKPPLAAPKKPAPKPESAAAPSKGSEHAKSADSPAAASKKPSIAQPSPTKFAAKRQAAKPKIDPSISVDDDSAKVSGTAIVIDAIAAAAAVAFTVLIVQEVLPFLK